MKKQILFSRALYALILLIAICNRNSISAQQHHHDDGHRCELHLTKQPRSSAVEPSFEVMMGREGAPDVAISLDQEENGVLFYETVAGWTGGSSKKAQLSLRIRIKNLESYTIWLNKVVFEYTQNGFVVTKEFDPGFLEIGSNDTEAWQNSRKYHEVGEVVYLDSPLPNVITVRLYFYNHVLPVIINKGLGPYDKTYRMPFRAFDLAENEVWQGGSTHGGGMQVFAYDLNVAGFSDGGWTSLLPGKDDTENENYRVWGKPIYAMANGTVVEFLNECPDNPKPGVKDSVGYSQFDFGGAGNHFYLQHGDNIALYAHMIKGSLNPKLLTVGARVEAGEFLGLAGNSGSSSGPHLHIHTYKETEPEVGFFRPLLFNNGWTIDKNAFTNLDNNANWFELTAHGLPGKGTKRAFIWPGNSKPKYNDRIYTAAWSTGSDNHAMIDGLPQNVFAGVDNTYQSAGLRLQEISVYHDNGLILYSGVWREGTAATKIQYGTSFNVFEAELNALELAGYRLIDVEIFRDANNNIKYAGLYTVAAYSQKFENAMTLSGLQSKNTTYLGQGFHLHDVEIYKANNGTNQYAAVWRKTGSGDNPIISAPSWNVFTALWIDKVKQGYHLVDVDTEVNIGGVYYVGVMKKLNGGHILWQSHWNSFYDKWQEQNVKNMRLSAMHVRVENGVSSLAHDESVEAINSGDEVLDNRSSTLNNHQTNVFPNPASKEFTISASSPILEYTLYNSLGQLMLNEKPVDPVNQKQVRVDQLNTGSYFLHINTADGPVIKQIEILSR